MFHDSGTFDPTNKTSAYAAGSLPYFLSDSANKGIGESLATTLEPKSLINHSIADIISIAGSIAVAHCGGDHSLCKL